jgi:aromatic-L-amino-acid decarboxylase
VAGLGTDALHMIDIDLATGAARPDHLHQLVEADRAAGYTPALIVASIGTTGLGAIDPVAELGRIARGAGAWLHVDAAWAGVAAVCPELRWLNEGLESADSYCTNPHKWLLTNFDCDAMWVAERDNIVAALSILPEYLRNAATESGQVIDYRDWHVPLGRRFRALKLWAVIRWYGAEGLRAHVRRDVALAQEFASWVAADDRFELVGPHPLALVTFRLRSGDEATQQLMERVNAAGRMYLTHTAVEGRPTLRMAIGSPQTEYRHVAAAWAELQQAADA